MKRIAVFALAVAASSSAVAQSRSSFSAAQLAGVTTVSSNGGLTYTVALSASPTMVFNNVTYNITDLFGFWVMRDSEPDNLGATNANFGVWNAHISNSGTGSIAGWKTNPNTGILPNGSQAFTFSALNSANVHRYGYHVRVNGQFPGGGNTLHVYHVPVPEPASLAALGLGAVALIRRRKR